MWNTIEEALVRFLLLIDSVIYGLVSRLFAVFVDLTEVKIFEETVIADIANRIYILVGIIALFIITYSLLNSVINPDNFTKGNNSGYKILLNLVTSIIMIILLPTIFNFAYSVQDAIIKDNIIGQLFLGTSNDLNDNITFDDTGDEDNSAVLKQYGSHMSWSVLNAFFYANEGEDTEKIRAEWQPWGIYSSLLDTADDATQVMKWIRCGKAAVMWIGTFACSYFSFGACAYVTAGGTAKATAGCAVALIASAATSSAQVLEGLVTDKDISWKGMEYLVKMGDFSVITPFAQLVVEGDSQITYIPIISTIVGLLMLYMIFSFCLDLGIRAVKLVFYQIIAPIPILARILPNNKMFNNWINVTITTFLEVFVRLIIIFTIVYLASNISEATIPGGTFVKMIIIISLVAFARQAPKLLAEVTGINSGNMKLGIMEKLGAGGALAAGAFIGGAVTTGFRNGINSWRNSDKKGFGRFASAARSTVAGAASGGFRSAKKAGFNAKSFGDMKDAASSGAKAAHKKSKDRQAYKAEHGGTWSGVVSGHAKDAWNSAKSWAGYTDDIVETVQYEDDFIAGLSDYEDLYSNGAYKADETLLNSYKAKMSAMGDVVDSDSGKRLSELIDDLEESMLHKRMTAVSKNRDAAAYAAYNIAKQVQRNPEMARKAGVSREFIDNRDDFVLRNNEIYHRDGVTRWTSDELQKLFEGKAATVVDAKGNVTASTTSKMYGTFDGLRKSKSDVSAKRKADKGSIHYKEAKKASDSAKK